MARALITGIQAETTKQSSGIGKSETDMEAKSQQLRDRYGINTHDRRKLAKAKPIDPTLAGECALPVTGNIHFSGYIVKGRGTLYNKTTLST